MAERVTVIGGGLAGSEAAWQLAEAGLEVDLYEMRPVRTTPAHHTDRFAELVCSNSFGSRLPDRAPGVLKEELRRLGSLLLRLAEESQVPAGGALAVDRELFARKVTEVLEAHPRIHVHREPVLRLPRDRIAVVATGPLTADELAADIAAVSGERNLYFFDAVSPIVTAESIDMSIAFRGSRYRPDDPAYINCPMTEEEYVRFWEALVAAETIPLKPFEEEAFRYFEGCLPIEVMAKRGRDTLAFGPLRPVGLVDPRTGKRPYAVVQLRQDNVAATLYSLVGFQTNLRWGEQDRVFRLIPGLEKAEFVRYGMMHRNTFINSPRLLEPTLRFRPLPNLLFAGQITGAEGYTSAIATGWLAGQNAARLARGEPLLILPRETMLGALVHYITHADPETFQPMKANYGLLPPLERRVRDKRARYATYARRALEALDRWMEEVGLVVVGSE